MYIYDDEIRRADLKLRCNYPELETVIYKINQFQYLILCKNYEGDFASLSVKFNHEIRTMCSPVRLTQTVPEKYEQKVKPITFDNPVDGFRASTITEPDVNNFIESKFYDTDIIRIEHNSGMNYSIKIFVGPDTSDEKISQMHDFLITVLGTDNITILRTNTAAQPAADEPKEKQGAENPMVNALLHMLNTQQLTQNKKLKWVSDESDYWFSYAEDIYLNRHGRAQTPYYRSGQKNCFLNCMMSDSMDIRKVLFLYETVYISMPYEHNMEQFLRKQRMTKSDLIELIDMGKVVLVLTNSEDMYDIQLLNEAYSNNPLGIVGRRGINVLLASYITELENRHSSNHPGLYGYAKDLYRTGHKNNDTKMVAIADYLTYPIRAKAQSFYSLNTSGLATFSQYGANTVYESFMKDFLTEKQNENLQLRFFMDSYPVHLSMALDATYFPYQQHNHLNGKILSDFYIADLIENLLSQYWYNNDNINFIRQTRTISGLEQLELFECESSLSVTDVAKSADDWNTPAKFGKILDSLTKLPLEEQNKMIRNYNHLLLEISKKKDKASVTDMIMTGLGFIPLNDALSASINTIELLRSIITSESTIKEYLEKKEYKHKIEKSENKKPDSGTVNDVYLLDKIYKVARLKTS